MVVNLLNDGMKQIHLFNMKLHSFNINLHLTIYFFISTYISIFVLFLIKEIKYFQLIINKYI